MKIKVRDYPNITFPSIDAIMRWQEQQNINITIHMPDKDGIRWIDTEPLT